jgi:putative ABC transport system permease protein
MIRIATTSGTPEFRASVIRSLERRLAEDGVGVETAWPLAELRTAMGDHIVILIRSLIAIATVMAVVGALGLSATMGVSVLERTREFGIMKTLGATPARIKNLVIAEACFIGALSWTAALALAIPLTAWLDRLIGNLGFVAPLPFVVSSMAILAWLVLVGIVSFLATLVPSSRASRISVIQALAQV